MNNKKKTLIELSPEDRAVLDHLATVNKCKMVRIFRSILKLLSSFGSDCTVIAYDKNNVKILSGFKDSGDNIMDYRAADGSICLDFSLKFDSETGVTATGQVTESKQFRG